jgi:signal transduction histidine kinase
VRKHAHAGRVQVALSKEDRGLAIIVTDDGVGFEADGGEGHFGLQTMTERAVSVGGRLNIHSTPDQGTEVALWLPLLD